MKLGQILRFGRAVGRLAGESNLGLIAAGTAFFGMFALFPALAALIALFGLVADPVVVEEQFALWQEFIPQDAYDLLFGQVHGLLTAQTGTLGWATALSTLVALWTSRAGVSGLIKGLNAVHGRPDRSGLMHMLWAQMLTVALIGFAVAALLVTVVAPLVLAWLPLPAFTTILLALLRWAAGIVTVFLGLGLLYRWGPNTGGRRDRWLSAGTFLATALWLAASSGFTLYLSNFGSYNEVYGSIGAVIALMMWMYISAWLVLGGALVNVVLARAKAGDYMAGAPEGGWPVLE